MDDGEGLCWFAGMEPGEGAEEGMDGALTIVAESEAIVVDVEVDVPAHNGLVHFPGVDLYIVGEIGVVGKSMFEAFADEAIHFGGQVGLVAAEDDTAQRDRGAGLLFPVFAEVEEFSQALLPVSEPVFVDDHTAVDFS